MRRRRDPCAYLVLPAEEPALPDVGEAFASAVLGGALLEAERLVGGVGGGGRGMAKDVAEVEEMLMRGGSLLQLHLAPLGDELVDGHSQHHTTRTNQETRRMWRGRYGAHLAWLLNPA